MVYLPVGAQTSNATNNAGACEAKHMKSASTSTTLRLGNKRGCSTNFGKFGSKPEAYAQTAGGTGTKDAFDRNRLRRLSAGASQKHAGVRHPTVCLQFPIVAFEPVTVELDEDPAQYKGSVIGDDLAGRHVWSAATSRAGFFSA